MKKFFKIFILFFAPFIAIVLFFSFALTVSYYSKHAGCSYTGDYPRYEYAWNANCPDNIPNWIEKSFSIVSKTSIKFGISFVHIINVANEFAAIIILIVVVATITYIMFKKQIDAQLRKLAIKYFFQP